MKVWDDASLRYIEITVQYSGKHMPGVGEDRHWLGSGSLRGAGNAGYGHGELLSPEDVRGKAPAGFSIFTAVHEARTR